MSYIVWDRGECHIFRQETEARAYISEAQIDDPFVKLNDWSQSQSGQNFVTVIRDYDPGWQHDIQQKYLLPAHPITKKGEEDE